MIKNVLLVSILASLCLVGMTHAQEEATNSETEYQGEFFKGMEDGFFLRNNPKGHKEYDCPDPALDAEVLKTINSFFAPIQMLLGLL